MALSISIAPATPGDFKGSLLAIPMGDTPSLTDRIAQFDSALGGSIRRGIGAKYFRGARDEVYHLSGPEGGPARIMLVGMGKFAERPGALRRAAAIAARAA